MLLKLISKEHLVDNVWAFKFQPSEPLNYKAGQFIQVELPHDDPDSEGIERWFTDSAAPYEGIMQITTRVTNSTFKQALSKLQPGDNLNLIANPDGDFVYEDSEKPVVFVAGGIGVTPFYSIVKQRVHDNLPVKLTLLYNSRTEEVPFKDEFNKWSQENPEFKVLYSVGKPLSAELITELVPDINKSLVYLSGPEPMVEDVGDQLKERGLSEAQLKQDYFPNYSENNY